jgi:hypothetical protein
MLDSGLAALYGVETKNLNKAVRRNINRFPDDFMFQLSEKEGENLRFQIGTSSLGKNGSGYGGKRYLPLVFTEQGVAMLSSVLRSERAALVNIEIMRAFVKLREFLLTNRELAQKLTKLERKYDSQFKEVFEAIHALMTLPDPPLKRIGIVNDDT